MTEHDLPPLDDDLRALVASARGPMGAPPGVESRVLAAVEAIVLPPLGGGGGGTGSGAGSGAAAAAGHTALTSGSLRALRLWAPLAASFVLGAGAGALAMRATYRPAPPAIVQLPPQVVLVPSPAPGPSTDVAAIASAPAPAPTSPPSAASSAGGYGGLGAERALLDVARAAIERQDGAAALDAIREHERRFPGGLLVQEREAMAVRALLLVGRTGDARARAARFRARFPGSVLLPTLDSLLGAPSAPP